MLYIDGEHYDNLFRCPIALISREWALTTSDCVPRDSNIDTLTIRLGSNLWSAGGSLRKLKRMIFSGSNGRLVAINFEGKCSTCNPYLKLLPAYNSTRSISGYSFHWNGIIDLPLHKRSKFEKIDFFQTKLQDCIGNDGVITCKTDQIWTWANHNAPMYYDDGSLMGFILKNSHYRNKLNLLDIQYYEKWLFSLGPLYK